MSEIQILESSIWKASLTPHPEGLTWEIETVSNGETSTYLLEKWDEDDNGIPAYLVRHKNTDLCHNHLVLGHMLAVALIVSSRGEWVEESAVMVAVPRYKQRTYVVKKSPDEVPPMEEPVSSLEEVSPDQLPLFHMEENHEVV